MISNAEGFLIACALRSEVVSVEGMQVRVQELSLAQRRRMLEVAKDPTAIAALVVEMCVIDVSGAPIFTAETAAKLQDARPDIINEVAQHILRISGLAEKPGKG